MTNTTAAATSPEDWIARNWKRLALYAVSAIAVLWLIGSYNGLMSRDTAVQEASANVSTLYQRRSDLIPNLVRTVEGAGYQERTTLREVTEARAKASALTIDPSKATAEQLVAMQAAQGQLAVALGKLLMVKEAYPDLKTNQNFLNLQSQIEGSENRISVGRQRYNAAVAAFNYSLRAFPTNIVNGVLGRLEPYAMFKEAAGAEAVPVVNFERR